MKKLLFLLAGALLFLVTACTHASASKVQPPHFVKYDLSVTVFNLDAEVMYATVVDKYCPCVTTVVLVPQSAVTAQVAYAFRGRCTYT